MTRVSRLFVSAALLVPVACAAPPPPTNPILIDGSSTLAPLTEAVVADFQKTHRHVPIKLASVGTAEGFAHFCRGELDILDASRPVSPAEQTVCAAANVTFIELPVAHDALTVMVNAGNTWASSITVSELRKLWEPFVDTYVRRAGELALGAGAAPLMGTSYQLVVRRLTNGTTGTMFKTAEDRKRGIDLLLNQ